MEDELIKFETAKLAKEKGFLLHTIDVFYQYDGTKSLCHRNSKRALQVQDMDRPECYVPTQSLLQKWLREEHKIEIKTAEEGRGYRSWYKKKDGKRWVHALGGYTHKPTYEEALEEGLQGALKLINNI